MRSLDPTPLRVSKQEMEELDWLGTATRRYKGVPRAGGIDGTRLLWSQRHSLTEWRMARTKNTDSSIFYLSLFPHPTSRKESRSPCLHHQHEYCARRSDGSNTRPAHLPDTLSKSIVLPQMFEPT